MRGLVIPLLGEAVDLRVDVAPGLPPVRADAGQLEQALVNLAVNARDALPHGGRLRVRLGAVAHDGGDAPLEELAPPPSGSWVLLDVEDDGVGMDAETLSRVFEPFFTTKEPGQGTGLGLSTVYAVVRQAGGSVAVDSEPGRGTRFRLWLPGAVGAVEPAEPARHSPPPRGQGQLVLLVEDEGAVRRLMGTVLEEHGYQVLQASNGDDALALFESRPEPVEILVSDVVMPGMDGPTLAARLREKRPSLRVLLVSGHPRDRWPEGLEELPRTAFLRKPFGVRELALAVGQLAADG